MERKVSESRMSGFRYEAHVGQRGCEFGGVWHVLFYEKLMLRITILGLYQALKVWVCGWRARNEKILYGLVREEAPKSGAPIVRSLFTSSGFPSVRV